MRGLPTALQGFLNAFATGILVFLLWDILSHAGTPVEGALKSGGGSFAAMALIFGLGIGAGLPGVVFFHRAIFGPLRPRMHSPRPRKPAIGVAIRPRPHNLSE